MSCGCKPVYKLPNFNLDVNVWHGTDPFTAAPDFSVRGALLYGSWVFSAAPQAGNTLGAFQGAVLLVPKGTDLRDYSNAGAVIDFVEVPAGTSRIYQVTYVDDIAKGFSNEHRFACIHKYTTMTGVWSTPIP